jgi:hypothetical protein
VPEGRIQERLLVSRRIAYQSLAAIATNVYFLACKSAKEKKFQNFHQLHLKYNHKYHHCHKYRQPTAKKKRAQEIYKSSREIDVCSENLICERDHGDL